MFDINTSIYSDDSDEPGEHLVIDYIDGLMAEFEESAEGKAFIAEFETSPGWGANYMSLAVTYLGETPATMTARDSDEIVFELIPKKMSVEADRAGEIIGELRAFWEFLRRTYSLERADEILESLTDDAVEDLKDALSDSSNFGMAKSFTMMGSEAGFDMTSQEGLNQFAALYNASLAEQREESVEPASRGTGRSTAPILNASPRVGRNDPCPCGSGKKYKKCCLQ